MTKRLILLLLTVFLGCGLQAQDAEKQGTSFQDAIPMSFSSGKSTFTDVRDTRYGYFSCRYKAEGSDAYQYTKGGAVYYRMETSNSGDVIIHNWNSQLVGFSTIFLLKLVEPDEEEDWSEGELSFKRVAMFEEADFNEPGFNPVEEGIPSAMIGYGYLHIRQLPPGVYYIVSAGYKYSNASVPNGLLRTTVIADLLPGIPDEPDLQPEFPNNNPVQYVYDASGNRIKTIKKQ